MLNCSDTLNREIKLIREAANEITELLTLGGCQKFQVLTETEIILTHLEKLETHLKE